ncbi:signal recognition particle-docking protein FtsY [Ferrimicrobium acidiphilum]|uniref:signal recognition particle-docking protein FtsY n=1 Tax=Ferrimicrobium acidiphilum TaxID=121039 RepID=UPI0023F27C36|nr:signal recognition particle-docking protein FtsY [Ferrimicrobium acidiphilum]
MESLLIVVALFVILGFGLALVRTRAGANRERIDKGKTNAIDGNSATEVEERPSDQHSPTAVTDSLAPEAPADEDRLAEEEEDARETPDRVPTAPTQPVSMTSSLTRSRGPFATLFSRLRSSDAGIDAGEWTRLEETLILSDMGPGLAAELVTDLKGKLGKSPTALALRQELTELLESKFLHESRELQFSVTTKPSVILVVGVNGTGKTTTIGKVASLLTSSGRSVMIAAGDTFRAAATEQVGVWASLTGVEVVSGQSGADPASVIFDAIEHARAVGSDVVLCDTAGRLQTKTNLMEELKKIRRVAAKSSGEVTEVLLVIDATTGQNGLRQTEVFHGAAEVTGIVLTKLDGSAKGGVALAIESQFGIPIKLVGLGEGLLDLAPFDPQAFVGALIGEESDV